MQSLQRSPASRLRPTFDRLAEIARLEEDWDTYGGLPPTVIAVGAVGQLIVAVSDRLDHGGAGPAPYSVMPIPNGGVQVTWQRGPDQLQVDVGPNGDLGFLRIELKDDERRACEAEGVTLEEIIALAEQLLR